MTNIPSTLVASFNVAQNDITSNILMQAPVELDLRSAANFTKTLIKIPSSKPQLSRTVWGLGQPALRKHIQATLLARRPTK